MAFKYVYILQSCSCPDTLYTGLTDDLSARLKKHNNGKVPHTSKAKPWRINTAIAFTDEAKAVAFEDI